MAKAIGRMSFLVRTTIAAGVAAATIYGSAQVLPFLAAQLAPHGINAGLVQNGLIVAGCALALLVLWRASHLRLRALGESTIWAPLALLPPAVLAIIDGPLFLMPAVEVPDAVWWTVMGISAAIALAVFLNCALRPSEI